MSLRLLCFQSMFNATLLFFSRSCNMHELALPAVGFQNMNRPWVRKSALSAYINDPHSRHTFYFSFYVCLHLLACIFFFHVTKSLVPVLVSFDCQLDTA